jgi:hypothetical protein
MNTSIVRSVFTAIFVSSIAALGCAAPTDEPVSPDEPASADPAASADPLAKEGENVGTTQQAFSGTSWVSWGTTTPTEFDTGAEWDTQTCFLTSLKGSLHSHNEIVDVRIRKSPYSSKWRLVVKPDSGNAIDARADCVTSVKNRTAEKYFQSGYGAVSLGPGAGFPNRRCFITGVRSKIPAPPSNKQYFGNASDKLYVFQNPNSKEWFLGGNGNADGWAMCLDVTEQLGPTWWSANSTFPLDYHTSGQRCFLNAIGGRFRTSSYSDGVSVYKNEDQDRWWLQASNSDKYVEATCAR